MKNTRILLGLQILLTVILLFGVQSLFAQNESPYSSSVYNVTFQAPEGAVKNAESTAQRTIYDALKTNADLKPRFEFLVAANSFATAQMSEQLGTDAGLEQFVAGAVKGFKAELPGAEITVTEKKRIKLAGLNAVKFVGSASLYGINVRLASYTVVVPEHVRMYNFVVLASDKDFDDWLLTAEKSVYSFALLKPAHK